MIRAVLCDIEGTTTSISFVHDQLFPISRMRLKSFVEENWSDPEFRNIVHEIGNQPGEVERILTRWIDEDRKDWRLKQIQGKIWKTAYESGQIHSHIYPDVPQKWKEWKEKGFVIYIFSSGSIEAQKLLFRYSETGDLTFLIDGFFDTTTGSKKEPDSYAKIAVNLNLEAAEFVFLSDTLAELDAARAAGMLTFQIDRDGSIQQSPHPIARSFHDIAI